MGKIMSIAIAFLVLILIGSIAITMHAGWTTTTWQTSLVSTWGYLPMIFILGGIITLLLLAVKGFQKKKEE